MAGEWGKMRSAATRRQDVAMGVSPWSALRHCGSAAERRNDVAMGVSPWSEWHHELKAKPWACAHGYVMSPLRG